ncbi:MAG: DUF5813 family protein [Natronomonas sp.]
MTDAVLPDEATEALGRQEAFEDAGDGWYRITTTAFEARVTAEETDGPLCTYTLEVRAPMLSAATEDSVGDAVEAGWFETYDRRLEDAPKAVRDTLELSDRRVFEEAGDAVAVFVFDFGNPTRAFRITKAMAEFVEGTYMEGIVPGYSYTDPVAQLLSRARQAGGDGDGTRGPMPL